MNFAVSPCSLIIPTRVCFYCNNDVADGGGAKRVSSHYGILHCKDHADTANRDIGAFLHTNSMIRVSETYSHPKILPLFDIFRKGIPVKRTSGERDPGWVPLDDPHDTPNLVRKVEGEWVCTFVKHTDRGNITKTISLHTIFEGAPNLPPSHAECLARALVAMDEGLYKDAAIEQERALVVKNMTYIPELQTRNIGRLSVRVLVPSL